MAEETGVTNATEESNGQGTEAKEFQAITSQEDFDKAIQARIARERAKIPTDYAELAAKAAKFDQAEDAKKTADQKNAERIANLEKDLANERLGRLRAEVATSKGVPVDLLSGSTVDELEASADALIQFRGTQADPRLHVPNEGKTVQGKSSTADQFAAFAQSKL